MIDNNRNVILAIVLSIVVLFGWQFLVAGPQMERARQAEELRQAMQQEADSGLATPTTSADGTPVTATEAPVATGPKTFETRDQAIAASPRVAIDTPELSGSISLTGGRLDDLHLKEYHETVDDSSPTITLLSPDGIIGAYFVEQGWVPANGSTAKVPDANTLWTAEGSAKLTDKTPITLTWDNGEGLVFRRTFAVDEHYLFTVTQTVDNKGAGDVALFPYARVERHGTPAVQNFFVQHEGPLGVLGSNNLVLKKYGDIQHDQRIDLPATTGWLGFTDKYWATTVMPKPATTINARFFWNNAAGYDDYQTSYVENTPVVVPAGGSASNESYVFAGAKKEAIISGYQSTYGFDRLEMMIDWGWFSFFTKPLFYLIQILYGFLGNFGVAVLAVTVIVKAVFFPLANRSYASMAAMRRVQPQMKEIQERFKDNRQGQQQAMMELYKKEKINPLSGCWPLLIQIPVFFALYTVIFISLEMRHAPFFGWIQDLAAPDPTNIFTLFGLIPWTPTAVPFIGGFLHLGIWPLIMGVTMWVQMRLNPPPPDPTQAAIFAWMPVLFTFMLGTFPAGLVIYWAWNNTLSIAQQYFIMKRHGAEVNLFGNIMASFKRKPKTIEKASN